MPRPLLVPPPPRGVAPVLPPRPRPRDAAGAGFAFALDLEPGL
ncbi:unnamed protein product [Haemonchus placei]|uniref:Uncharacterized protein n=1 Tax=Haemonchus placei TaxID=6290 RepID=A0A3P7U539_HAEPC|nr:unnamed protein product [Haemonchus placei]